MNAFTEGAGAFSVDDSNAGDPFVQALGEVFRQEFTDLRRAEGVEVEFRLDGDAMRLFVHSRIIFVQRASDEGIFRFPRPSGGHNPPARQQWWP